MATGATSSRVKDLVEQGDKLFSKRTALMNLLQETALNFYPERADFTQPLPTDGEYAAHLMTGTPVLFRRDLANTISAMLRPRGKTWFRPRTHSEQINEDAAAQAFLDRVGEDMRVLMYEKPAQFLRATKQGDNDWAAFGQCVISIDPRKDLDGLLYRAHHIRDTAWCENAELVIDTVHRNGKLGARALFNLFKGNVSRQVAQAAEKDPYREIKCRHIVIPADHYDYQPAPGKDRGGKRKLPFVSLYVDVENDFVLEETPAKRVNYVIPRWATISGSQYAHSPATVIALPDARLLQQINLTLLEAGQKVVDPPSLSSKEAIQGPLQLFAGGNTWIDTEYDERTGEAFRYLQIDPSGLNWGGEREKIVTEAIKAALFLNQIDVPYPQGNMTATEYQGRVQDYVMRALPLFEPMEIEYNGGLCELTFESITDMNGFGALFQEMPDILRGQDIRWTFESPLQAATERAKSQAFIQCSQLLQLAVQMDPTTVHDFDASKSFRDAITGTGAPADWIVPEDKANAARQQDIQQQAAQAKMASIQQAAQTASAAGQAGGDIGIGAEGLRNAGLV